MTIKTFSNSFQDNYFTRIPILYLLDFQRDTDSDVFVTINHSLALIKDFTANVDFLSRESSTIQTEVETIFDSLENKIAKMRSYSEAIIGLNSTFEDEFKIKSIKLYDLKANTNQWEYLEKCLTLPATSTYKTMKPYKTVSEISINKNSYNFVLPTTESYKALAIRKESTSTNITKVIVLDSKKNVLQTTVVEDNINKSYITVTIPLNAYVVTIEAVVDTLSDMVTITPLFFYFEPTASVSLETLKYDFATYLTLQSRTDLPKDCILQLDLQLIFYDLNGNITTTSNLKMSINNDSLLIDKKGNTLPSDTLVYLYKDNTKQDIAASGIDITKIAEDDYVLFRRNLEGPVTIITEDTLKFDIKNSKSFDCIPTLNLYSMTSQTLTPKLYNLIGITKNDSN